MKVFSFDELQFLPSVLGFPELRFICLQELQLKLLTFDEFHHDTSSRISNFSDTLRVGIQLRHATFL